MSKKRAKITDREYWPDILKRLEELAAQEIAPTTAASLIAKEFSCSYATIYHTMQRGEVSAYRSSDRNRVRAWQEGRARYIRGLHCQRCDQRVHYTCSGQCCYCMGVWEKDYLQKHRDSLKSALPDGDFNTGRSKTAEDKAFFGPKAVQKPFTRGCKLHAMAVAMQEGATLDELSMVTGWIPDGLYGSFDRLRPKGYGVERRDGRYYLLLADGVDTISVV